MADYDFQLEWHVGNDYPDWGAAPRGPLVQCDFAHKGELLDTVIGTNPATSDPMVYYVLKCEYCIAAHVWPLPDEADLLAYYARTFYEREKPDMVARYEADAEWWATCMHGPMLDTAAQALGRTQDITLLDVGAGPGLLVRTAAARGWHVTAIEPSAICVGRLLSRRPPITVWPSTLRDYVASVADAQERYDIVTLWETLEHTICPEEVLLDVWGLLKPGGVVAVCVPNDYNPLQLQAGTQLGLPHYWLAPPQHLWYFTPKCLQLLLRRCGFAIVDCRGTFPMEDFLIGGRNYVGHDDIGRLCHQQRIRVELTAVAEGRWPEVEAAYRANLTQRIGREMIFWGRKIL